MKGTPSRNNRIRVNIDIIMHIDVSPPAHDLSGSTKPPQKARLPFPVYPLPRGSLINHSHLHKRARLLSPIVGN